MFLLALLNLFCVCDPGFFTFCWFLLNFTCRVCGLCFSSFHVGLFCQRIVLFPVGCFRCAASSSSDVALCAVLFLQGMQKS